MNPSEIDFEIAEVMWRGVAGRPCDWSDLDGDEKAEWAAMARAARLFMVQTISDALSEEMINSHDAKSLAATLRNLAKASIRKSLGMPV